MDKKDVTNEDLKLTPDQIVSQNMMVVLPGEVYAAIVDLFETMLRVSTMDEGARSVTTAILQQVVMTAVPVKRKDRQIIMPGLPQ